MSDAVAVKKAIGWALLGLLTGTMATGTMTAASPAAAQEGSSSGMVVASPEEALGSDLGDDPPATGQTTEQATGQASEQAAATGGPSRGPNTTDYAVQLRLGINLLRAGDATGAIVELRRAVALDASRSDGAYLLAEAQRMSGDLDAALEAFRGAARIAQQAEEHRAAARALMGVADTLERIAIRPPAEGQARDLAQAEAARDAWMEYARFGDAHQEVARPQIGRARAQALTTMIEQERVYVEVRQRIAARVEELARQEQERQESEQRGNH